MDHIASPRQVELLSPLTLETTHMGSFSTQSTSACSQSHSETELHPDDFSEKKKRTVTFAEIDISELDYQATKTAPEEKRRWKRQAIRRKLEKKEYRRRIKMGLIKGSIIFLFFMLCSVIVLLATAQGTHTKI